MNIVFAGTPAFSLPCLHALASSKHRLLAVYTQPDRPAGRGRELQASPVKTWAQTHAVPIYQPVNFKTPEAVDALRSLAPDVMVVIAYGLILPPAVLAIPRWGCINVHASMLPRWRGASPIQQAILHGDTTSGITIMQLDEGMDTGPMLAQTPCPIAHDDTALHLHDKLAQLATTPLLETLDNLPSLNGVMQDASLATYAPKILKEHACIDWTQTAFQIDCQIRAYYPWPIAFTSHDNGIIRIHSAAATNTPCMEPPGTIMGIDKHGILVATSHNALLIKQIQYPGGKALAVSDWLHAGKQRLQIGDVFCQGGLT